MDTKMDVKKDEKKDAIDGVLRKCTIASSLVPDCSPQLGKNYTKIIVNVQECSKNRNRLRNYF